MATRRRPFEQKLKKTIEKKSNKNHGSLVRTVTFHESICVFCKESFIILSRDANEIYYVKPQGVSWIGRDGLVCNICSDKMESVLSTYQKLH